MNARAGETLENWSIEADRSPGNPEETLERLRNRVQRLETGARKGEDRRRAMLHIINDLNEVNHRLADQRKAILHLLGDYEKDRSRLARQAERLDNSRRALLRILQDIHQSNLRFENGRKAMIHIMKDLRETTGEVQRRERELREKQEQLVQAGKLATLGELTTGIAHELNNPLNNIGLFLGNAIDVINLESQNKEDVLYVLRRAMKQVDKATEIITHLRTFGRAAHAKMEPVRVNEVILSATSLVQEQLRLRETRLELNLSSSDPVILGNAIQLEQVMINLLTNAWDAMIHSQSKVISIICKVEGNNVEILFSDSGTGISPGLEQRIFDPFFTTKEVGAGTGLGLSITYGIIKEHQGTISVENGLEKGAMFRIQLPLVPNGTS